MGTWITHIRIAENLLDKIDGLDVTSFAYGNLAPDSGKPNHNWTKFTPPKSVTHFLKKGMGEHKIRDLEYYQNYLLDFPLTNHKEYSFRLGYFFHLLCDNLWRTKITHVTKKHFATLIEEDIDQAWTLFKKDWYTLDHLYIYQNPDSLYWQAISKTPNPKPSLPFLDIDGLNYSLDYIRDFYNNPSDKLVYDRKFPYLNEKSLDAFVSDATNLIFEIYVKKEQLISLEGVSALSLLSAEKKLPFSAPLGDTP